MNPFLMVSDYSGIKGALVTLSRPLAAGLRISVSVLHFGFLHQDFPP